MIYSVKTDGCMQEIEAATMDEAAGEFAADEFPKAGITTYAALVAHCERLSGFCDIVEIETSDSE